MDQIPPILPKVGKAFGASRLATLRHILLPAALPMFLNGLKQGWAFSWRSLMAAELIATSPQLGHADAVVPANSASAARSRRMVAASARISGRAARNV